MARVPFVPLAVGCVVIIAGAGLAGFFIGKGSLPDEDELQVAEQRAFKDGLASARAKAFAVSHEQGERAGLSSGEQSGTTDGATEGKRAGHADGQAELAAAESTPVAADTQPAPGTPGSDVCVTYQDYVPGVGCVPPVAPGETAAPIECPPGQVPVGVTGACGQP